jgi:hypothetical protein
MARNIDHRFTGSLAGADDAGRLCRRCGMRLPSGNVEFHTSPEECIRGLREALAANLDMKNMSLRRRLDHRTHAGAS